ncbi:phosphoribosylglycinamide formyltransferase [bacterium]|nr:MAG: phosphoribosylglycinamide formyltransferase [bacterium]
MNLAIFASGRGTNFSAIAEALKKRKIKARIALLLCDNPQGLVIKRAEKLGIKVALVRREAFARKKDFESGIIKHLVAQKVDLIVLAGFMRLLSPFFVRKYKNKIINIHPALLPSFKGAEGIQGAFSYGVKVTGVTVHFVDQNMDHGPIILQAPVTITEDDTLISLEKKIHRAEHRLYAQAINLFVERRLKVKGRKVKIITR